MLINVFSSLLDCNIQVSIHSDSAVISHCLIYEYPNEKRRRLRENRRSGVGRQCLWWDLNSHLERPWAKPCRLKMNRTLQFAIRRDRNPRFRIIMASAVRRGVMRHFQLPRVVKCNSGGGEVAGVAGSRLAVRRKRCINRNELLQCSLLHSSFEGHGALRTR